MKIASTVLSIIAATSMFAAVGTLQAACYKHQPGWHYVSKRCDIPAAANWQQYASGVYTPPVAQNGLPLIGAMPFVGGQQ